MFQRRNNTYPSRFIEEICEPQSQRHPRRWMSLITNKQWSNRQKAWFLLAFSFFFYCFTYSHRSYIPVVEKEEYPCYISAEEAIAYRLSWETSALKQLCKHYLWPPSTLPYNLEDMTQTAIYSQSDIEVDILPYLFNNRTGGIFIEAGGADGEHGSNTLGLERFFGWTGLLVEPDSTFIPKLFGTNRKAWIAPVCLAFSESAHTITIEEIEKVHQLSTSYKKLKPGLYVCPVSKTDPNHWAGITDITPKVAKRMGCIKPKRTHNNVTCLPLHALLYTLGMTDVDYFSLDVEGAELEILKTIPWSQINIKVIQAEFSKFKHYGQDLIDFLASKGYRRLTYFLVESDDKKMLNISLDAVLKGDYIFVKNTLTIPIT